jgi:hypothetical protein
LLQVSALAVLALSSACRAHVGVGGVTYTSASYGGHMDGAFSTSSGSTGIEWNPPAPAAGASPNEIAVQGSDGTFGWQSTGNADVEIHKLSEALPRAGCAITEYKYDETKATCGEVSILLRRDATRVFRLCAPGTDRNACTQAWAAVVQQKG